MLVHMTSEATHNYPERLLNEYVTECIHSFINNSTLELCLLGNLYQLPNPI